MIKAKVTSKGQLTIPKALRDELGLEPGDYIIVRETTEGYVIEKDLDERRIQKYVGFLNQKGNSDQKVEELRGK